MASHEPTRRDLLWTAGSLGVTLAASGLAAGQQEAKPAPLPFVKPDDIGLDAGRLQLAYDLLEKWTQGPDAPVPGGAIAVGRRGKMVEPRFFGRQGPEPDAKPIRRDGMFLMASITKPITYLAGLMLVERGLLNLTDPVARYLPEFAANDKQDVLVLHLFTHTSGLPDMLPNNEELRRKHAPLQAFLDGAVRETKLLFKPGTQLSYQSMGTATVAQLVQKLTGEGIADFLRKHIFDPLGMKSTALGSKGVPRERLVRVEIPEYQQGSDFSWNSPYWQELGAPWGGLFSTPEDFAVICQLMLNHGRYNGVRLLSRDTVKRMTTNRLDDLPDLPEAVRRTEPWGLGWRMNHPGTPGSWGDLLSTQVFGHTGATGTMVWMNPRTKMFCILLTSAIRSKAPWRLVHLSNIIASALV